MAQVEAFFQFLDNINSIIDINLNKSLEKNSVNLEVEILNYVQQNCSSLVVNKGPMLEIINNSYKPGTDKYKDSMKFKVADIKYNLSSEDIDLDKNLKEEIRKLNILFNSISLGSNINYLDCIKNTLGNIMKYLIEKSNGSISFARKSMQIRNDIEIIIGKYFKFTMNDYGEGLKDSLLKRFNKEKQINL